MSQSRWSSLFGAGVWACVLLAPAASIAAPDAKLELKGRVLRADGKPLAGATVGIYTAGPRVGIGSACPGCYPECRKSAVTDAQGRFELTGLSDLLLYNLLIVAQGHVATFVNRADPRGTPVAATLQARDTVIAPGLRTLVGHVVDSHGTPVAGASVSPVGIQTVLKSGPYAGQTGTIFGDMVSVNARIDPLVISDGNGEFRLTGPDSVTAWVLRITARGSSPAMFPDAPNTGAPQLFKLDDGATVTGLVLRGGKPVPGAVIGITQVDRNASTSVSPDTIAADENGRFTFANVPAGQDYAFSGIIESLAPWALRTVVRTVGEVDSVTTLPPLQLEPGHRLSGRVLLSDGKAVPLGTQLVLTRRLAGNFLQVPMDSTGHFELSGLPPETVNLTIRMKGYRISPTTHGYTQLMQSSLWLPILHDFENVEIVLEPVPKPSVPPVTRP